MEIQILTDAGFCEASLKSEAEVAEIRQAIHDIKRLPKLHRWFDLLKDGTRFKLVVLLYYQQRLCVCDLANILEVSSSAVSQHLRKLKDMNLVSVFRHKQTLFYELKDTEFREFLGDLLPG